MPSIQRVTVVGHLGSAVNVKQGTMPLARFSVATSFKEKTTWFKVTCFGKLSDIAEKLFGKGDLVYCEGRLALDEYVSKEGEKRTSVELIADRVMLLKKQGEVQKTPPPIEVDDWSEVPF